MCKFCEGETIHGKASYIEIERDELSVNYYFSSGPGSESSDEFKINYCPMCGRKLEESK